MDEARIELGPAARLTGHRVKRALVGSGDSVDSMEALIAILVGLLVVVLHLSLLSRVSAWTHASQKKLDETNQRLGQIDQRLSDTNRLLAQLVGRQ